MSKLASLLLLLVLLVASPAASAHEVLHEVERGRAIAVKVSFSDGEAMAYASYEVFCPSDARIPYQKGRTDRRGYLAFVPDAAGKWRVKIADDSGHGLDTEIEVASPLPDASQPASPSPGTGLLRHGGTLLRPVIGLVLVAAVFAALFAFYRRKGAAK